MQLESSMPEIVSSGIGIVVIVAGIDRGVFFACLGLFVVMAIVCASTSGRNLRLNRGYNHELERQVQVLTSSDRGP